MAKKKPKSGKRAEAKAKVPEARPSDVYDDPGPTRALPVPRPARAPAPPRPAEVDPDDVYDDPGPTRAMPLEEEQPLLDAGEVHDDPGPTKALPPARVLDEIETAMALGRLDEVKVPLLPLMKKKDKPKGR